ncbi:unnamed protein product, partial [Allacma fusca]
MPRGNLRKNIPPISMSLRSRDGEEELQELVPPPGSVLVSHSPPNTTQTLNIRQTESMVNDPSNGSSPESVAETPQPNTMFSMRQPPFGEKEILKNHALSENSFSNQFAASCTQTENRSPFKWGTIDGTSTFGSDKQQDTNRSSPEQTDLADKFN